MKVRLGENAPNYIDGRSYKKYCKCGNTIQNPLAKRCRKCYLQNPNKGYSHNFSKKELQKRSIRMKKLRKKQKTWNKGMNIKKERPELVQQMINSLKGQRCNPKGEFKKGHKNSLKHRKHLICRHHIDRNHENSNISNLLYLLNSSHNSLHKRAYDYLVEIGLINQYINWFKTYFNPKLYTIKDYYKQKRGKHG